LQSRVAGQLLYHDVFSTYMRHFVQDDPHPLKYVIRDIMKPYSSLPKRCTIGPLAQLNSMVSSWTTNGKATTASSLLVFEDNIGEDGLSSQSTYKVKLIQYPHASSFSIVITNHFIGEEFCLGQTSINGYEAMGFDVTQLTQDDEQSLFTIKTDMPIPMFVYGDSFQWAKYGHSILPPSLDLTSLNKAGLHQTFQESLIEFLCTDLDGNLSSNC
jgi:hypothetical protein